MCLCQSYKGNIKSQSECQSERRAALISKHMEITARSGSNCASRMEAGWRMLWKLTASWMPTHRGCCSWGMAVARCQGRFRIGGVCVCVCLSVWVGGGGTVIAGSVEERGGHYGPRFSAQHSRDNSDGAHKSALLTSAIQRTACLFKLPGLWFLKGCSLIDTRFIQN